jgi:hypothetical protein
MAYYSGKSGTATIPGITTLAVKTWSADHEQDTPEVTNKSSNGFYECIAGIEKLSGSADCVYNGHFVVVGSSGALTLNTPDMQTITATTFVTKVGYESDVAGAVTVKIDWVATGSFTIGGS